MTIPEALLLTFTSHGILCVHVPKTMDLTFQP